MDDVYHQRDYYSPSKSSNMCFDNRAMVTLTPVQSERTISPTVHVNISESDKSATKPEQKLTKIKFCHRIQIQHFINLFVIVIVTTLIIVIEYGILPSSFMGYTCEDPAISHKFRGEMITPLMLLLGCLIVPLIALLSTEVLSNDSFKKLNSSRMWFYYKECAIGCILVLLITEVIKVLVGEHRPHFLDVCEPDTSKTCVAGAFIDSFTCTNTKYSARFVVDTSRSFPSGHASVSSFVSFFSAIFRHGERTPDKKEVYLKSQYYNESIFDPFGFGQLTNNGKNTMYNLGKSLRARYKDFLNPTYHYTLVEGTSTYYERTKESLQLVLAGLFPVTEELSWNKNLSWTPIATYYNPKGHDELLKGHETEEYKEELENFRETNESKALTVPFHYLIELFIEKTGEQIDLEKLSYLCRGIELLNELNLTIPEWIQPHYPDPLAQTIYAVLRNWFGNTKLKKFFQGRLLKKIIEDTEKKISKSLDPLGRQMFLYSTHDHTIIGILNVLDIWNQLVPPVGSYCVFEVHRINGTYGFKFFFYNTSTNEPQLMELPDFGKFAPVDEFKRNRDHYINFDDASSLAIRYTGSFITVLFIYSAIHQL